MLKCFSFTLLSILLNSSTLFAQQVDSILNIMATDFAQEKVFVHFDKSIYNKGETIWFKAYIMDGNLPSVQSKNFYADWYDDNGALVKHTAYPVFQSSAKGEFIIPESYAGSNLHIKAYTKWMLNFDTSFLFNKHITVLQAAILQPATTVAKSSLQFFPEGGDIINGVGCFVAFKATNQFGKPIGITGVIKNNLEQIIDSIKTEHDGMGSIFIAAPNIKQAYTAYYKDDLTGIEHVKSLPTIIDSSVGMQVQNLGKVVVVNIKRSEVVSDDKKYLKLYAIINNQVVYKAKFKLVNKSSQTLEIPADSLPTGIMQISLFNANFLPLAERIVFVKNDNYQFEPSIKVQVKNVAKRAKNVVEIFASDSLLSNMSVAITDASIINDSSSNIYSQLLLCGDIKGTINHPEYYFLKNDETTQQKLDLVMLTNGWRKYNWQKIAASKLPLIRYKRDTTYLQILGKSFGLDKNDLLLKPDIMLFLQSKDSTKRNFILPLDKEGFFGKTNFIFYDTIKIYYTFLGNAKLNRNGEVAFQNGLFNTPSKFNLDTLIKKYASQDYTFFENLRKQDAAYKRLAATKGSGVLNEVTVKSKSRTKTVKEILDEKYASGMFASGDAYQFDVTEDIRAQNAVSVFSYLQGMVAGLQINTQNGEAQVNWRGSATSFFLNEINTDAANIENINMNDVAYIKVFKPPFFGGSGGSPGGAIAIYTRKGGDVKSTPGKGLGFKFLEGYTAYKEFYAPNYEQQNDATIADIRTTLYWNPYILTDAITKKATITFFNNDVSKKLRVILYGMNTDGKLAWVEKIIE